MYVCSEHNSTIFVQQARYDYLTAMKKLMTELNILMQNQTLIINTILVI